MKNEDRKSEAEEEIRIEKFTNSLTKNELIEYLFDLLTGEITVDGIKDIISSYRNSKKVKEHGFSLRVALSQDTINKFQQGIL